MLIRPGMVEVVTGTTALSLIMQAGQSALVRDIHLQMPTQATEDFKITVDRKSIVQWKAPTPWCLLADDKVGGFFSIMSKFRSLGLFPEIPIAAGEELAMTAPGTSNFLEVVYDLYEAGDIVNTQFNGSKASSYRMFQVVSNSAAPTAAGDWELDQSDLDTEFPAFPGGDTVPSNTKMELRALFGSPVGKGDGANNDQNTDRLKFIHDREDIFDKDLAGILFGGDNTSTGAALYYSCFTGRLSVPIATAPCSVITFDDPPVFHAGDELNIYATITETTAANDMSAGDIKLGLVLDVSPE